MNISAEPGGPRLLKSTPRSTLKSTQRSPDEVIPQGGPRNHNVVLYINKGSNAEEVQEWLQHKGFSKGTRQFLHGRCADELFRMSCQTLEKLIGRDEGNRMQSQLTFARNLSGYTLGRSRELAAILKLRKEQTEVENNNTMSNNNMTSNNMTNNSYSSSSNTTGNATYRSEEHNPDVSAAKRRVCAETKVSNVS